jgi:hypothetical protein
MNRAHANEPQDARLAAPAAPPSPPPAATAPAGDANRLSLLKKPPADRSDPLAALRAFQAGGQR